MATLVTALGMIPSNASPSRPTIARGDGVPPMPKIYDRRRRLAAAGLLSTFVAGLHPANAFENGINEMAQYRTQAKLAGWSTYPGTQPMLGLQGNGKLASCNYELNCFSTSGDDSHLLKQWRPKAGSNAMGDLMEAVKAYPPFQARIDGGGFKIITASSDYLYVQFESLRKGFIDDVEFAITQAGGVQVRSSSRIGYLDLGVNAKRLNWISASLRDKGWTAPVITKEDYPEYFQLLNFTYDDYIRSVLSPQTCPSPSDPLNCLDPITAKTKTG
mmetsp:Transcript_30474/g.50480  ORF Transcript_30474/g.50480 Transcript_30474/m.50480 type:complete len:273 (+) Transcript_30474:62-880(+)